MDKQPTKGLETLGEAARRLLCRLDERAKTSGEMPEQIQIGMRPLAETVTGAAPKGPPRAPVTTCLHGRMRQDSNFHRLTVANDNRADFTAKATWEAKQ